MEFHHLTKIPSWNRKLEALKRFASWNYETFIVHVSFLFQIAQWTYGDSYLDHGYTWSESSARLTYYLEKQNWALRFCKSSFLFHSSCRRLRANRAILTCGKSLTWKSPYTWLWRVRTWKLEMFVCCAEEHQRKQGTSLNFDSSLAGYCLVFSADEG